MSLPMYPLDEVSDVTTGSGVAELLHAQHAHLSASLCRVPRLHRGAREDVFLLARRHLAVHTALEEVVVRPRLPRVPDHFRLDAEVVAAEQGALESIDFDAALTRLTVAFLHHVHGQERHELTGPLAERERSAVDVAVRLWDGDGDAYLGNTWADMLATACELVAGSD